MYSGYTNCCVLSTFGLTDKQVKNTVAALNLQNVNVDFTENFLVGKLVIFSEVTSIDFQTEVDKVVNLFKEYIYCDYPTSLEEMVITVFTENGWKLGIAESLTGGMICSKLASISGCSNVLYEGFITYDNRAKVRRLHVPAQIIDTYGAVSEQTCKAMAKGVLANKELDFSISTTGCAGPTSDEQDTPIGKNFIGIGDKSNIKIFENTFEGDRNFIRECVSNCALFLLLKNCQEKNIF
ncbi:MAG: CinA family protein [Clostridia bacterium]